MSKLTKISSILITAFGVLMIVAAICSWCFISQQVSREQITTPQDASIPNAPVQGPLTLKAQSDIIREHALDMTDGQTYAEMPRQIEQIDANGNKTMVDNTARNTWITVTALTTALNLGLLSYGLSALVGALGIIFVLIGLTFYQMNKKKQ
ncbi:hypothetical protein KA119_02560 [Candidatus Gracilibacteria bacterium]|nr:hypothetical protein [Candidatus Gracilibacteria bacterium]